MPLLGGFGGRIRGRPGYLMIQSIPRPENARLFSGLFVDCEVVSMWPFSSAKKSPTEPAILAGEICILWNMQFDWWEFTDGEFEYSLVDNPEFDVAVLDKLGMIKKWLVDLDQEIDAEIKKNLDGSCRTGEKHVVDIDISGLISKQEIDVTMQVEMNGGI
jgi:hypothetical protein